MPSRNASTLVELLLIIVGILAFGLLWYYETHQSSSPQITSTESAPFSLSSPVDNVATPTATAPIGQVPVTPANPAATSSQTNVTSSSGETQERIIMGNNNLGPGEIAVYAVSTSSAGYGIYAYNVATGVTTTLFSVLGSDDVYSLTKSGEDQIYVGSDHPYPYIVNLRGEVINDHPSQDADGQYSPDYSKEAWSSDTSTYIEDTRSQTSIPIPASWGGDYSDNICDVIGWSDDDSVAYAYCPDPRSSPLLAINTNTGVTAPIEANTPPLPSWDSGGSLNYYPNQHVLIRNLTSCGLATCKAEGPPSDIEVVNTETGTTTVVAYSDVAETTFFQFIPASDQIIYSVGDKTYTANISNVTSTREQILDRNTFLDAQDYPVVDNTNRYMIVTKYVGDSRDWDFVYIEKVDGTDSIDLGAEGTTDIYRRVQFIGWYN